MKHNSLFLFIVAFISPTAIVQGTALPRTDGGFAPWKIVSAADWHSTEGGVLSKDPAVFENNQKRERDLIRNTLACFPEVVMIAGDQGSGRWTTSSLKHVMLPDETLEEAIYRFGWKTYRSHKDNFVAAGLDRLLVCVGDHDVGDNDWPVHSERSRTVPWHRLIYGQSYNMDRQGRWLWGDRIGEVPARPLGTKYENTSFATVHKNVLFVMVDLFHQESPGTQLHPVHGSVIGAVTGAHLDWLESVLAAGRRLLEVKYIFVQGHLPVMPPVRAHQSSTMYVDQYTDSSFWQTLRRHQVDLYFAGEIHATTLSKDPESNVVHLVTDRKLPTVITVYNDKLTFQCCDRGVNIDNVLQEEVTYFDEHQATLSYTGDTLTLEGSGLLKPLDREALFIHYPFEKLERTPLGPGKYAKPTVLNHGELNCYYDGEAFKASSREGVIGNGVALAEEGVIYCHGLVPFGWRDFSTERTISLWFKTTARGKYNLFCDGNGGRNNKFNTAGFLDLILDKGTCSLRITDPQRRPQEYKYATRPLNNGRWHHVALVVSPHAQTLNDLILYIDSQLTSLDSSESLSTPINAFMYAHSLSLGGPHKPTFRAVSFKGALPSFHGTLDEFAAWNRALSDIEVRFLYLLGQSPDLKLHAGAVDKLLRLVLRQNGTVHVNGRDWYFTRGLTGPPGRFLHTTARTEFVFDTEGNGIVSE